MKIDRLFRFIALAMLLITLGAASATADTFQVTLTTAPLTGVPPGPGPFALAFQLTGPNGNTAILGNFMFGAGSVSGSPIDPTNGGAIGDLAGGLTLDNTGGDAFFAQLFNPGSTLSFLLTLSNNFSGGSTPDAFALSVCTADFSSCFSDNADTGALLTVNLTGGTLNFQTSTAIAQGLSAPAVSPVPEPGSMMLLGTGLAGVLGAMRKRLIRE